MSNCTIIIPTYNRPAYLRRILDYYSQYGEDFSIIVADSSSSENKKINKDIISSISNLDIQHLDHYSTEINPYYKFADMVNYAKEEYCVFCADDDFITPNGIKQSVDFLEKNPDFAVAHGYHIVFHQITDEAGTQQFCWSPTYSHQSIPFPDPRDRLNQHLSNYSQPTIYAVHRTDFLRLIFEEMAKFTNDDRFGELLPSVLTLIYGKMKCLDMLYAARESIPTSAGRTSKRLIDFIRDGTYNEKYAKFGHCLSAHLSKQSNLDIEESEKIVDEAMSAYLNKHVFHNPLINKMGDILDYLRLPDSIDKSVRRLYTKLTRPRRTKKYFIEMSPSSKDYDDFNKIRLHVLSHSKGN